jgi:hypothetical protein
MKILAIIACHTNNQIRYNVMMNNIQFIKNNVDNIILMNSKNEKYAESLEKSLQNEKITFDYIDNNCHCDFGKYMYALDNYKWDEYDVILFMNDSIIITNSIDEYFDMIKNNDAELYGFIDSTEIKYHYPSFLFAVNIKYIYIFYNFVKNQLKICNNFDDLIQKIEIILCDQFKKKIVFVETAEYDICKINIFFYDDLKYKKMLNSNILPIIKLKRLTISNYKIPIFIYNKIKNLNIIDLNGTINDDLYEFVLNS